MPRSGRGSSSPRAPTDPRAIRRTLDELEFLAREALDGERHLVGPLRDRGEALLRQLAGARAGAPGDAILDAGERRLAAALDHALRAQRPELERALERLREDRPTPTLARQLADLLQRLRRDADDEERRLLNGPRPEPPTP